MSKSANVLSVDTLRDFKVQMINFAEDARGRRAEIGSGAVADGRVSVAVVPPAGTRRLAAVLRGRDGAGDLVAVVEKTLP